MIFIGKTQFHGYIKAYADTTSIHPLQTIVELVITPFTPNSNNQCISENEADNILKSALNQPLKINFDGQTLGGHKDSVCIGPIIYAEKTDTEIIGRAVIWSDEFQATAEYLKKAYAANQAPGTSWEIYYKDSRQENGIEYLQGCVFAANTIVSNPSYGAATMLRSIAEDLTKDEGMSNETKDTNAEGLEQEREEITSVQDQLWAIWSMLDNLYYKTFEIEEAEATKTENLDNFSSRLNDLVTRLNERATTANVALSEATVELTTLKAEKAKAEEEVQKAKTFAERSEKLKSIGIDVTDRQAFILSLSEELFTQYLSDLATVKTSSSATAEAKIKLPEPLGKTEYSTDDLISAHKEHTKNKKVS